MNNLYLSANIGTFLLTGISSARDISERSSSAGSLNSRTFPDIKASVLTRGVE